MIETIKPSFSSGLAAVLQRYVAMKRALGRQFNSATHALQSLDRLLAKDGYADLNATAFNAWCKAQEHLASGVRRVWMLEVPPSACIAAGQNLSASCLIPRPSRHIISASGRTSLPNRRSRGC